MNFATIWIEYLKRADFPYKEKSWYANVRLDSVVTLSYFEVMLDNIEEVCEKQT